MYVDCFEMMMIVEYSKRARTQARPWYSSSLVECRLGGRAGVAQEHGLYVYRNTT